MSDEPASPRRYHHGNLREALVHSAEAELQEHGLEQFSLRGVAKRAGVSHAAPAHHFGDTTGLLTALATVGFERLVAFKDREQAAAVADSVSQLVAAGLGYVAFAEAHPALFHLMFTSRRPDFADPALCAAGETAYRLLVEDVRRVAADAGIEDEGAVEARIAATWALAHGLADLVIAGRLRHLDGAAAKDRRQRLSAILLCGLAKL
jgi:AcrR family transcriptional regulator